MTGVQCARAAKLRIQARYVMGGGKMARKRIFGGNDFWLGAASIVILLWILAWQGHNMFGG